MTVFHDGDGDPSRHVSSVRSSSSKTTLSKDSKINDEHHQSMLHTRGPALRGLYLLL